MADDHITHREPTDATKPYTPYPMGELQAVDERDAGYRMETVLAAVPVVTPPYWYLSLYDSRNGQTMSTDTPLNQGRYPACVGGMAKHILLCGPVTNRAPGLSLLDIYNRAKEVDEWAGTDYDGTSVRAGFKVLVEKGYGTGYYWTDRVETVCEWIGAFKRPVGIGVTWREEMFYPGRHGGYLIPSGDVAGGHAVVCDGYNLAQRRVRILNSWGSGWGSNGRAWIRFEHLQQLFDERAGMTAASLAEVLKG